MRLLFYCVAHPLAGRYVHSKLIIMRRISVYRDKAKVRGIERRFKALEKWANDFEGKHVVTDEENYYNFKIPVLDRLVNPPKATHEHQKRAIECLLTAAGHLVKAREDSDREYYKVAVLLVLPNLFQSEVTVFFSKSYYQGFYNHSNPLPKDSAPSLQFNINIPESFNECGGTVEWDDEYEDETVHVKEQWWTIGQTP